VIDVVYAMGSETIGLPTGLSVPVQKGTHWPADDPVVKARPALFSSDPRYGLLYTAAPAGYDAELNELPESEAATANPGERRSARRP
jgi:hypothetical protein